MSRDRSSPRRRSASRRKTVPPEQPKCRRVALTSVDGTPSPCDRGRALSGVEGTPAREPHKPSAAQREFTTKRRGELAELAFALKAASLGFGVARPWGDSERYDCILDADDLHNPPVTPPRFPSVIPSGASRRAKRIGPRSRGTSGSRTPSAAPQGIPTTNLSSSRLWRVQVKASPQVINGLYHVNSCRRVNGRAVPYTAAEIDFFAAYIIPEDTWYILPVQEVVNRTSLLFRQKRDRKPGLYDAYREAWHLLRRS